MSPALAPVWRAVHERLSSGVPVTRVRVGPLDAAAQAALADLLGLDRWPGERPTVLLARLDEVLQEAVGADTRAAVEHLVGPLRDRAGERRRAAEERSELWSWLAAHPVLQGEPALLDWLAGVRRAGLIGGSVARTRAELERVLGVLAELPAGGVPLPVLADRVLGDPHALDEPGRCAGLVLRAVACLHDLPVPAGAEARREAWERVGVATDELSSTVLAAGLRATGDDLVPQILRLCADAGQAAVLNLGQLRAGAALRGVPADVWVFENPAVLALALRRYGRSAPPLVCISGWPSAAAILLLRQLAAAGARLHYHGDFDGDGLRIAANVADRTGAVPWRMSSADYLEAVADGPPVGRVTPAPWDTDLAGHLVRVGVGVPEERVADELLADIPPYVTELS